MSAKFIKDREEEITEPFKGDLWGRKQLGEKLTHFISNLQCGATIALDAEWGAGKTWFVKNWKVNLEANDYRVIYIDAFAQDFIEDPFLILSMEILNAVDADATVSNKFKDKFISAYHAVLPNLPMLIWSLAMTLMGAGHFSKGVQETITAVKDATGEAGEKAGALLEEGLKEHLTDLVDNYNTNKNELKYFKEELGNLVKDLEFPLVFIVDELDRCKPEFSIKLIERIKHFFDIPNIVFVLSTNKAQLEESINSFYGFKSANSYLEKFIDLNIKFPKREYDNYIQIIRDYTSKFGLQVNNKDLLLLSQIFDVNSRELYKIMQKLSLLDLSNHGVSLVMAFSYLAMEQKALKPSLLSESDFFELVVSLIIKHDQINEPRYKSIYDYSDSVNFANEYGKNLQSRSGLEYFLRLYYLLYTKRELSEQEKEFKHFKYVLNSEQNQDHVDFVKSWDEYINSGFLIG